jgi:hypothetical protein
MRDLQGYPRMERPATRQRHYFIDLYRSAVILLMLEGHVLRAFLPPTVQNTFGFQIHEFFHGLSAPAFLFGAGLTFVISTRKRWEAYHHWDSPLAKRVKRLLLIILIGYFLHLPFFSIRKILLDATAGDYIQLFQCDVLHCIGIGLLSLHALIFFFKKESRFYILVMTTIGIVCFFTPFVWDIDFTKLLPIPLSQLLNGNQTSPFPLFPYIGFLYAGVIVSWEFLVAVEAGRERRFMKWLAVLGSITVAIGVIFDHMPFSIYPAYNYWFTSPNYFLVRVGSLMLVFSAIWYIAPKLKKHAKLLTILGIESLFVYIMHLIILYGSVINPNTNLIAYYGTGLTLLNSILIFLGLLVLMVMTSLLWNYLKTNRPNLYRIIQVSTAGILLTIFFTLDF